MECGNHEDVRWTKLFNNLGSAIKVLATGSLLQISALPYSDEQLAITEYKIDLPKSNATVAHRCYTKFLMASPRSNTFVFVPKAFWIMLLPAALR